MLLQAQNFEATIKKKIILRKNQGRKSKFQSLIIEKDFEPENPKKLEELDEKFL